MKQPRQRHIPLNIEERQELDRRKRDYEYVTGDTGDWGKFLGIVSLAGLAALGVYSMAQVGRLAPTVWQVNCPHCRMGFPIQVPNPTPWRLTKMGCVNCSAELVVDFAKPEPDSSSSYEGGAEGEYSAYCYNCQQPIKANFSHVSQRGFEYLKCPHCDRVPRMSSWE
ncbi:MAG TPA: hypothetical protein G4O13_01460 [Dehalococcoidia bacterium]|nr:hypothetical protein [Dehalococcoidia bacterium]